MVEFALVLPLLLMVVMGVVQLGLTYNNYLNLTDAVRAGARVAAVSVTAPDPREAAKAAVRTAASGLDQSKLFPDAQDVTAGPGAPWRSGDLVQVTATYPYTISIFGLPLHTGSLTSSTTERVE